MNTKISEVENKIPDHAQYSTTQEFNTLTAEIFGVRLTQVNLLSKTDFDTKLMSFNRKITWNKTKYFEILKKINKSNNKRLYIFLRQILFYK